MKEKEEEEAEAEKKTKKNPKVTDLVTLISTSLFKHFFAVPVYVEERLMMSSLAFAG